MFLITSVLHFFSANGIVKGDSMYPNFIDKETYKYSMADLSNLTYGDVVVCVMDTLDGEESVIKRVIGMSGDTIEYKDNVLYRNGEVVDESEYIGSDVYTYDFETVVDDNSIFVMGDNREWSYDSRYVGSISMTKVMGKVK